jgi:hypothetical protein
VADWKPPKKVETWMKEWELVGKDISIEKDQEGPYLWVEGAHRGPVMVGPIGDIWRVTYDADKSMPTTEEKDIRDLEEALDFASRCLRDG